MTTRVFLANAMKLGAGILVALALGAAHAEPAGADPGRIGLPEANAALQAGQADAAMSILASLPPPAANSAEAHNLRCRVLFTLEQWDAAAGQCQEAANMNGQNSVYQLWLGRALGEQADNAPFWTAYNLAKRARAAFELSVQIDARNPEALADLGEFYSEAPGVVGGGTSKAESIAARLDRIDPARAHELRSGIAQEAHDYGTAEREMREAVAVSPHPAFQWMRLASFYRKMKRFSDMENAVRMGSTAADRDHHAGVALFNGASVLMKAGRNPALAIKLLQDYLASPAQTEEAPAFVAHLWLARLQKQAGDSGAAARERSAALGLASNYKPAQDLKL
ncbi:MAG TPA: hypothetical protein VKB38_06995 [Terracidiphilus sp.]|nr:hypothetical protein [Terracidiphilus sp.]